MSLNLEAEHLEKTKKCKYVKKEASKRAENEQARKDICMNVSTFLPHQIISPIFGAQPFPGSARLLQLTSWTCVRIIVGTLLTW